MRLGETAELTIFGSFKYGAFSESPFKTVGILGGKGRMGQWFNKFLSSIGCEVIIYDLDSKISATELCNRSDVLILSLPMDVTKKVFDEIKPFLNEKHLVVENCSIKSSSLPYKVKEAPSEVEVLGIHTMFANDIESLKNQNVIVTNTDKSKSKSKQFEDILYKYGARITHASVEDHDKVVSFIHSLMQLALISMAEVMRENFKTEDEIEPFSSPNSRNILNTLKRIIHQEDELIRDIQVLNSQSKPMQAKFQKVLTRLTKSLEKEEVNDLLDSVEKSRRFFKK